MADKKAYIHLVTGGQRSGKSSFAQSQALTLSSSPVYLATSRVWDEGHRQRIERHKADRGPEWQNIEEEKCLGKYDYKGKVVVLDCVTLWLTNFFFDNDSDIDKSLCEAKAEFDKLLVQQEAHFFVISNEIGMGGHASNEVQLKFTDLQGWMNQYIAQKADRVTLMVSGLPLHVK